MSHKFANLDYPVGASPNEPIDAEEVQKIDDLREWMNTIINRYDDESEEFEEGNPRGRVYVARTIQYQSGTGLAQTGSAPCFFCGVWSLGTCKKGMRGEPERSDTANPDHPFQRLFGDPDDEGVRRPKYPVFILTCASRNRAHDKPEYADSHRNWLASAAMVTHGFDKMDDYGRYLRRTYEGEAVRHRLTHASDRTPLAENRGDCHVDDSGAVRYPPANHQHGDGEGQTNCGCNSSSPRKPKEHIDNSENHIKCVSEPGYWLGWTEPQFALKQEEEFNQNHRTTQGFDDLLERFEPVVEVS
jgi:hypothetical protein